MNRKDCLPTTHSVICIDHFGEKLSNVVKNINFCAAVITSKPSIHNNTKCNPSFLKDYHYSQEISQKTKNWSRWISLLQADDKIVDIDSISEQNLPEHFIFKRFDKSVLQIFNLKCNEETGIVTVHECISGDTNLHVRLSYQGLLIPLPKWFLYENNRTLIKFSMLENFVSHRKVDRSKWTF